MHKFTGSYKKCIAGIGCALIMSSLACTTFATQEAVSSPAPVALVSEQATSQATMATNTAVSASVNPIKPAATKPNSTSQLASLLGGLVLIVALIVGLSWFVKRFSQGGFLHNPNMKIISTMPLGTRERLLLIDIAGKHLLLGVTATQINTLHVFDNPIAQPENLSPPPASDFSQKLMAILQQKNILAADDPTHKKSNP